MVTATLAAITTAVLAACSGPAQATEERFQIDVATPLASLDPADACSLEDLGLLSDLYPTLVRYQDDPASPTGARTLRTDAVEPALAQSWTTSPDGRTYTFRLREARFPSGNPVTADVVRWSWQRTLDSGGCGSNFVTGGARSEIESVAVRGEREIAVTLTSPTPDYLLALTSVGAAVLDRDLVLEHAGTDVAEQSRWIATNFAGGGPYTVDAYAPGTSLDLSANPAWWGAPPLESRVRVSFITNDATLLLRARGGRADVTLGLSKQSVRSLDGEAGVRIVDTPSAAWQVVGLPTELAPFDDPLFREALTYATPQEQILRDVAHGYGQAYYGPFSPTFPAYREELSRPRPHDPAKARELVARAGVRGPVDLDVYVRDGIEDQIQIATILQQAWKDVGVNLRIRTLSAAEYQNAVGNEHKRWAVLRHDGPSVVTPGWVTSYDTACGHPYNPSNYCNPRLDALAAAARTEPSAVARQADWDRITRLWTADSPRVVAYAENYTAVLDDDVTDFVRGQNNLEIARWGTRR
ncbi:ABC transporter substrate-binding protein [Pseudonocardia alni]|uniref:ABC transporter substrate-binding protein n=1 Tax=Pseudonocardia alni TaxID=33907 RepID=UPI0033DC431A